MHPNIKHLLNLVEVKARLSECDAGDSCQVAICQSYEQLARRIANTFDGPEATVGLRKLLESLDAVSRCL